MCFAWTNSYRRLRDTTLLGVILCYCDSFVQCTPMKAIFQSESEKVMRMASFLQDSADLAVGLTETVRDILISRCPTLQTVVHPPTRSTMVSGISSSYKGYELTYWLILWYILIDLCIESLVAQKSSVTLDFLKMNRQDIHCPILHTILHSLCFTGIRCPPQSRKLSSLSCAGEA